MDFQNTLEYTPLQTNEIRILALHPGEAGDPIQCSLIHAPLHRTMTDSIYDEWRKEAATHARSANTNEPWNAFDHMTWDYYCFSKFFWAPRLARLAILYPQVSYEAISYMWGTQIADQPVYIGTKKIYIRPNLYLALESLRTCSETRNLWIDAICINQADILERNAQISIMGSIYRNSNRTVIWLGEGTPQSDAAFDAMNSGVPEAITSHASSISALAKRPYWDRLWIAQEIFLTKFKGHKYLEQHPVDNHLMLACGTKQTNWNAFEHSAIRSFDVLPPRKLEAHESRGFRTIHGLIELPSQPTANLIKRCGALKCQDPRDRVYGVLGMAWDAEEFTSLIDYGKNLRIVYFDVLSHTFKQRQRYEGIDSTASNLMPFSQKLQVLFEFPFRDWDITSYHKGDYQQGPITGELEMITPSPDWQPFGDALISAFSWQTLCEMLGRWKELISDDIACQRAVDLERASDPLTSQIQILSLDDTDSVAQPKNLNIRIFVTADGDYGVAPMNVEVGDGLCVDSCWSKMDPIAIIRPRRGAVKASLIGRAVLLPRQAESYKYEAYETVSLSLGDIQLLTR